MATRKLTSKRIQSAIFDQCQAALVGTQVNVMDLGTITDAAEAAYANQADGSSQMFRLTKAREAAEAKVAELRTDKPATLLGQGDIRPSKQGADDT